MIEEKGALLDDLGISRVVVNGQDMVMVDGELIPVSQFWEALKAVMGAELVSTDPASSKIVDFPGVGEKNADS